MTIPVNMPGLPRRITTQLAALLKLREKALKGDLRAFEILDRKFSQHAPPLAEPHLTAALLDEDLHILADAQKRSLASPLDDGGDASKLPPDEEDQSADEGNGGDA